VRIAPRATSSLRLTRSPSPAVARWLHHLITRRHAGAALVFSPPDSGPAVLMLAPGDVHPLAHATLRAVLLRSGLLALDSVIADSPRRRAP
jgi:hypothetical protein